MPHRRPTTLAAMLLMLAALTACPDTSEDPVADVGCTGLLCFDPPDATEEVIEDAPETPDVPEDIPEDTPDDVPEDTIEEVSEDVVEEITEDEPEVDLPPECLDDADCIGLKACRDGQCAETGPCLSNLDCDEGRACTAGACADAPPECGPRLPRCPDGQQCAGGVCGDFEPEIECLTDDLEPNNGPEEAAPLAPGVHDLQACPEDEDWVSITTPAGDGFVLLLLFSDALILDANLFEDDGDFLEGFFDFDRLGLVQIFRERVSEDTTFHVQLVLTDGAPSPYRLDLVPLPGGFCADDPFEPNDTPEGARPLPTGELVFARKCNTSDDFFTIEGTEGQSIVLEVGTDEGEAVAVDILAPDGQTRLLRDTSSRQLKRLTLDFEDDGPHIVRVFPRAEGAESRYTLEITAP